MGYLKFSAILGRGLMMALVISFVGFVFVNSSLCEPFQHLREKVNTGLESGQNLRFKVEHQGLERLYKVHLPASYNGKTALPLIVVMHGGGGNMEYQSSERNYGLISKSEEEGFIVVFPNGTSRFKNGKLATWNAGNCCGRARDRKVDDVGFIARVVEEVEKRFSVDKKRIYATGMSNGAMMAYRLACEMPDVFKAIAAVAGTDNTQTCTPSHPVSVLHIHALNDERVLFTGGIGPATENKSLVTNFVSVADSVAKWRKINQCPAAAKRVLEKPGAYCDLYSPCKDASQLQLCVTEGGGHSWPGGEKRRSQEPPSKAILANDVMWDFFSSLPDEEVEHGK